MGEREQEEMANAITHFSHPNHQLLLGTHKTENFNCDFCKTAGSGLRYLCNMCDFDIHESCTTYPETLSFFAHPWHTLLLADHSVSTNYSDICDLCREHVKGFWYKCTTCGFNLHLHCSLAARIVRTRYHPNHFLSLMPANGSCSACNKNLSIWTYRCGMCDLSLHYKCLFTSGNECSSVTDDGAEVSTSRKAQKPATVAKIKKAGPQYHERHNLVL